MTENKQDLVIIGGGAGGLVVASVAGQLGLRVTLVERQSRLGGDCLHHGCVPSKTLIRSAQVAQLMRRGAEFGLPTLQQSVDLGAVMARVRAVVEQIQQHDDPQRFRDYGVDVRFGTARFRDPHRIEVNDTVIEGRRFVIATGSRPQIPPIPGLVPENHYTNETIFGLKELPRRLSIMGAGPIGLELAQAFQRLGSQVTLLEQAATILPQADAEASSALIGALSGEGIRFRGGVQVQAVEGQGAAGRALLVDGETIDHDALLVATGRRANIEALALDAAGVEVEQGRIRVDRRQRSSRKHIYAVGDVCGPHPFTHMAEYQAGIVISNAVFRWPKQADYRVVPRVTYTDPELAQVGITATEAEAQGLAHEVLRFDFAANDRALAEAETAGFVKLVVAKGRLLGATVLGHQGGELIHELALAMQTRTRISVIAATIHAYPTLSQAHRRAVNSGYSGTLFHARTRRLVHWLNRLLP